VWLADENFGNDILRGLRRRDPRFDVVRVQDILELGGSDDPAVLEWAGINERILPTHDVSTRPTMFLRWYPRSSESPHFGT